MWALVDCNSFFCSVEKVFHPGLKGKPVCVLSSNDGCIVALTPEAKALGLHRGDPLFRVRDIVERGGVTVFSGNLRLYAAMSKRITSILRKGVARVENYSIDESFCSLDGYSDNFDAEKHMRALAEKILKWTDVPVSVGIAPSKTLAKMGSKFAKQYRGYRRVCMIDTEEKRRKALALFDLSDVWGIGRQTLARLNYYGVRRPLDFADKSEAWVRQRFTLPGVQTWLELNGKPCIDTAEVHRRQTICTSRSFGEMVERFSALHEAVTSFASSCACTLRGQGSLAQCVTVFACSNRFRSDLPQYANAASVTLPTATADTMEIAAAAKRALTEIFVDGIAYKKAGVVLSGITDAGALQLSIFDPVKNRGERAALMRAIDDVNHRYGLKSVRLGAEWLAQHTWQVKSEHRSPDFLTDINQIPVVAI